MDIIQIPIALCVRSYADARVKPYLLVVPVLELFYKNTSLLNKTTELL